MSRRRRVVLLASLALLCGIGSAALASRYRAGVEAGFGEARAAVVVREAIDRGERIDDRLLGRALGTTRIPLRFLAPDALADPLEALGRRAVARLPAGSVLLASHLREPSRRSPAAELPDGTRPVEVRVSAAGSLGSGGRVASVDVIVAREPGVGSGRRVGTIARGVPLLSLRRGGSDERTGSPAWVATLALARREALAVIEAENFAREVRLLAR